MVLVPNETDAQTGARGYRLLPAEAAAWLLRGSDGEGGSRHAGRYATRPTRSVSRSCRSAVRSRVRFCPLLSPWDHQAPSQLSRVGEWRLSGPVDGRTPPRQTPP